jgi:hypothetical protein
MMRLISTLLALHCFLPQPPAAPQITFKTADGDYAILRFAVHDEGAQTAAAAVDVLVDGVRHQVVIVTPGAKRPRYDALLGPVKAGSHEVRLRWSSLWAPTPALEIEHASADVVRRTDPRYDVLANAPAIGLRPDTIGTASDLPLLMYVEESSEAGSRWLRYSIIFSHEDGGTPGPALMARWGRTTDIELAYEVELRDGRIVQARYQGPDHRVIQNERLDTHPPFLLVSTLNNMFLDRGHSGAIARMAPVRVDLSSRSRESVMDDHPWIYRVMARELATERPAGVGNPRDYLYVDVRLSSRAAGIAIGVRDSEGTTSWSDLGRPELVVSRQGEMRIAVPIRTGARLTSVAVRCDPRVDPSQTASTARCEAELRKAFRLNDDNQPQASVIAPARLTIQAGTARDIPVTR